MTQVAPTTRMAPQRALISPLLQSDAPPHTEAQAECSSTPSMPAPVQVPCLDPMKARQALQESNVNTLSVRQFSAIRSPMRRDTSITPVILPSYKPAASTAPPMSKQEAPLVTQNISESAPKGTSSPKPIARPAPAKRVSASPQPSPLRQNQTHLRPKTCSPVKVPTKLTPSKPSPKRMSQSSTAPSVQRARPATPIRRPLTPKQSPRPSPRSRSGSFQTPLPSSPARCASPSLSVRLSKPPDAAAQSLSKILADGKSVSTSRMSKGWRKVPPAEVATLQIYRMAHLRKKLMQTKKEEIEHRTGELRVLVASGEGLVQRSGEAERGLFGEAVKEGRVEVQDDNGMIMAGGDLLSQVKRDYELLGRAYGAAVCGVHKDAVDMIVACEMPVQRLSKTFACPEQRLAQPPSPAAVAELTRNVSTLLSTLRHDLPHVAAAAKKLASYQMQLLQLNSAAKRMVQ